MGFLTTAAVIEALTPPEGWLGRLGAEAAVAVAMACLMQVAIVRPHRHRLTIERTRRAQLQLELAEWHDTHRFATRLDAAIRMADSEPEVLGVVGRALAQLLPNRNNALLIAPPHESRVTWSIPSTADGLGEPVAAAQGLRCSALGTGHTMSFASSTELDACPHLIGADLAMSGVCVPLIVGDAHLAVLHSAGAEGDLPDRITIDTMNQLAQAAGTRIAALRYDRVETPAPAIDPLTGLPSQTAVHRRVRDLLSGGVPFSLALCDLDAFGAYNHEHGPEVGDIALRLYADAIGATLRPDDVVARYAGDKFLCVFPNCTAEHARAAMERVRESLVLDLTSHELAPFTVSVGICHSSQADHVKALVEIGDVALAVAKNLGGNRVCLDDFAIESTPD